MQTVSDVKVLQDYRVWLKFSDGVSGELDLSYILRFKGPFLPLRDPDQFARAFADPESGTICWPNGADLDPLVLYSKVTGKPIPWAEPETPDGKTAAR